MSRRSLGNWASIFFIALLATGLFILSGCSGRTDSETGEQIAYYTCGMHPSVKADEPGKCPICHMDLVPVPKEEKEPEDHNTHKGSGEQEGKTDYWTCGMHPSVKSDKSGKCPICHMDLVPVKRGKSESGAQEELPVLKASSRARQLAGVKTGPVAYRHLHKKIRTVGHIAYDERKVARVSAWIPGRIDRLLIDYTGQLIKKGDPLALLYSPDLISTQKEYILALENLDRAEKEGHQSSISLGKNMLRSTEQRLLLWGVSPKELQGLKNERRVKEQMTINAPIGGTVVEKAVLDGQYVKEGQHLYTVADLSSLWMLAHVYEYEQGWIDEGQKVSITSPSFPGKTFEGRITFIDPVLDEKTRTVRVRTDLENFNGQLKPGLFVDAVIDVVLSRDLLPGMASAFDEHGGVLSIPVDAVLQTGLRKLAYQEVSEGEYAGRLVEIGPRAGDYYPLLSGLREGDRVVTRGNFLIDSQTQLTGLESAVYDAALGDKKSANHQHQH